MLFYWRFALEMVEEKAAELGQYSQTRFWYHGTFMNKRVTGGPVRLPDAIIFLNTLKTQMLERHPAIVEAAKMCIPTVGIVDSNCRNLLFFFILIYSKIIQNQIWFHFQSPAMMIRPVPWIYTWKCSQKQLLRAKKWGKKQKKCWNRRDYRLGHIDLINSVFSY